MGLTIHYSLVTSLTDRGQVAKLVEAMRQFALDLPFQEVSEVMELCGEEEGWQEALGEKQRWLLIQGTESVGDTLIDPLHAIGFYTLPGPGCESANFAFCSYPACVPPQPGRRRKRQVPTRLQGWRWSSYCKTQYASDPRCGGTENFLRCHLSVIKMLDFAKRTGVVTVQVSDEGGYRANRDLKRLVKEVGEWNEKVAGLVGLLRPVLEEQGQVEAPITGFASFEHLEAKGLEKLSALWQSLDGEGRSETGGAAGGA
jgi:hypothetical protein